jgi:REP element-mobilizing transposase RayT
MRQQVLELRTWGGRRRGAGRKPTGKPRAPHDARERVRPYHPVHVTLRMADHVWNLRSERSFRVIDAALRGVRRRRDFRIVDFDVLGNHVHFTAEADGTAEDRYHAHVLKTPAEVRNARRYVLGNFASHAKRRGEPLRPGFVDPFSSASGKVARTAQLELFPEPSTQRARTWLMRKAGGAS